MSLARWAWGTAGVVLVGTGIVGVFVPGLPTTVFLVMALFCFRRSWVRGEQWLLGHGRFGPVLRDWDENRWMTLRTKAVAVFCMWVFSAASVFLFWGNWWPVAAIFAAATAGNWYVLSRRTKPVGTALVSIEPVPDREPVV